MQLIAFEDIVGGDLENGPINIDPDIGRIDYQGEDTHKFLYSFLNGRISNSTYQKIFERKSDPDHFYVFTQNNKAVDLKNRFNPILSELTLTRFQMTDYLNSPSPDDDLSMME